MFISALQALFAAFIHIAIFTTALAMCACAEKEKKPSKSEPNKDKKKSAQSADKKSQSPKKDESDKKSQKKDESDKKSQKDESDKKSQKKDKSKKCSSKENRPTEELKSSLQDVKEEAPREGKNTSVQSGEVFENAPEDEKPAAETNRSATKKRPEAKQVIQIPGGGSIVIHEGDEPPKQSHPLPATMQQGLAREPYRTDEDTLYDVAKLAEMPEVDLSEELLRELSPTEGTQKSDNQKPDAKKSDNQKPDAKKPDAKKSDNQKPDAKKPDAKKTNNPK